MHEELLPELIREAVEVSDGNMSGMAANVNTLAWRRVCVYVSVCVCPYPCLASVCVCVPLGVAFLGS